MLFRSDEIIAKIPSEKQQYYVGKAYEESQAQAVGMGLQLSQIKAQTNLMNAEAAKAYADANKTKGADTDKVRQDITESKTRIDEIIAKIPSEKQQYYIGKAHEEALQASKLLTEAAAAKTDEEKKVLMDFLLMPILVLTQRTFVRFVKGGELFQI